MLVAMKVVVVGNGMVGHRFCERLVEYGGDHRVIVCGEEPRPAYDRVHLTDYFDHRDAERLQLGTAAWYAERGIELRVGTRIARIDRDARAAIAETGDTLPYDALVL